MTNHGGYFGKAASRDAEVQQFFNQLRSYENSSVTGAGRYTHRPEMANKAGAAFPRTRNQSPVLQGQNTSGNQSPRDHLIEAQRCY